MWSKMMPLYELYVCVYINLPNIKSHWFIRTGFILKNWEYPGYQSLDQLSVTYKSLLRSSNLLISIELSSITVVGWLLKLFTLTYFGLSAFMPPPTCCGCKVRLVSLYCLSTFLIVLSHFPVSKRLPWRLRNVLYSTPLLGYWDSPEHTRAASCFDHWLYIFGRTATVKASERVRKY